MAPAPHVGDLIIHCRSRSPTLFALSTFRGKLHVTTPRYEDAFDRASQFAAEQHVDAWFTHDEESFMRVGRYRRVPKSLDQVHNFRQALASPHPVSRPLARRDPSSAIL